VIAVWFFDTELSAAHGILFAVCRFGLLIAFQTAGYAAAELGPVFALNLGTMVCTGSLFCSLIYWNMEAMGRRHAPSLVRTAFFRR
jgi:hypothetical protein